MASTNPIPSRAAINALRGVALTTSCSVFLLAEERRQRLKLARSALDNARKLHSARVNQNSVAWAEAYAVRQDVWPADLRSDHDVSSPANNPRRRRRRNPESRSGLELSEISHATISKAPVRPATTEPSPKTRPKSDLARWDASLQEPTKGMTGLLAQSDRFLRIPADKEARLVPMARHVKAKKAGSPSAPTLSKRAPKRLASSKTSDVPVIRSILQNAFRAESSAPTMDEPGESKADEPNGLVSAVERLSTLDQLIAGFETPQPSHRGNLDSQMKATMTLLDSLRDSREIDEKQAVQKAGTLLQVTAKTQQYDLMRTIFDNLDPARTDTCALTVPTVDYLLEEENPEGVRSLLTHASRFQARQSQPSAYKQRHSWLDHLLLHYWGKTNNFVQVKRVYKLLQDGGLYTSELFSPITCFAVRRRITLMALDAGDDTTARVEMEALKNYRSKKAESDIKLRGRFIIRNALMGDWDAVTPEVTELHRLGNTGTQYQNVLSWLTEIYSKDHSPEETDNFVRDLVENHSMAVNKPLAFLVIDRHGRNQDLQGLTAWLQFCQNSGLELDQLFFNEIADACSKYWNLARLDVIKLLKGVRAARPWIHDPHLSTYSVKGPMREIHKSLPSEAPEDVGLPVPVPTLSSLRERDVFRRMNSWAVDKQWNRVSEEFEDASQSGMQPSVRCLRLAVVAHINIEGPQSKSATELINTSRTEGLDVSSALVPLLVARLEAGEDVGRLLQDTLSQGSRIHDSVYNKAARIMCLKGNQLGAIKVCELAAIQNGERDLAYNKFNFSSLVFAYTGQSLYKELQTLLTSFNSCSLWWHGSKECKESVKRAMKAIAARAVRCQTVERQVHEDVLDALDSALEHIKSCRAAAQQGRLALTEEIVEALKPVEVEVLGVATLNDPNGEVATQLSEEQKKARETEIARDQEEFAAKQRLAQAFF